MIPELLPPVILVAVAAALAAFRIAELRRRSPSDQAQPGTTPAPVADLVFEPLDLPIRPFAIRLTVSRRRDVERLLATPGPDRAAAYRERVFASATRWLERARRRSPRRTIAVRPTIVTWSDDHADFFVRNVVALDVRRDVIAPPRGILDDLDELPVGPGTPRLSVPVLVPGHGPPLEVFEKAVAG